MENYVNLIKDDIKEYYMDEVKQMLKDTNNNRVVVGNKLYEEFINDDSITGNLSGSYTFNTEEAKNIVLSNIDEVVDAYKKFYDEPDKELGNVLINNDWEKADVIARCAYLYDAINELLNDLDGQPD